MESTHSCACILASACLRGAPRPRHPQKPGPTAAPCAPSFPSVEAFALAHARPLLLMALDAAGLPPPLPCPACAPAGAAAAGSAPGDASACAPGCRLLGVRLLSVESAQRFYAANGFGAPDEFKEMFKPLSALQARRPLAAACELAS